MEVTHPQTLLVVLFVAAIAPLFNELPIRLRLPLVVVELLIGMAVGPQGLNLVAAEGSLQTLSALGLSFLFFLAGLDLDFSKLRGRPLELGALGWLLSIGLGLAVIQALYVADVVTDPVIIAVALSTTAIGTRSCARPESSKPRSGGSCSAREPSASSGRSYC